MKAFLIVTSIFLLVSCSNTKSTSKGASERTVYMLQNENATCLTAYLNLTDSDYAAALSSWKAGACPASIKVLSENLTLLKKCGKYKDEKNNDPNSYDLSVYSKKIVDGKLVAQTPTEATAFCESYLDNIK